MGRELKSIDIARLRLNTQRILGGTKRSPVDSVRHMTAMQGQDLPGTLWAIGLRSGATEQDVRNTFDRGELIRSWPMRGTLHALTPDDLRMILPLSRDRTIASLAARHRELEISSENVTVASDAAVNALTSDTPTASRKELFDIFERAGQPTAGQRGAHLIFLLAHAGLICLGPFRGKEQVFVLLDEWATPTGASPDRAEALAAVALRYFSSHGPATVEDLAWWTKLTLTDARAATAAVRSALTAFPRDGRDYFASQDTAELAARPPGSRSVLVLPGFDEYLLGYTDRSAALAVEHSPLIVPSNNGMFKSTVVVGGRVVGTWTRKDRTQVVDVTAQLFRPLTGTETTALARAFDAYGAFREKSVSVTTVDPSNSAPNPTSAR
ncbi:winged helix DNA-binding domain-containing protein [Mycetocola zhadangensis]|uniref:winged helix DNA-binding domain-containing protein n=1 Tax=Mycetocola zhadangensis TaxID=1164595 RepID=UPI003A4D3D1A